MDTSRYEQLTVGILIKREAGVFGPRGLALFYDATQKSEPVQNQMSSEEYTEETIYGKLSRIGGKHKYPNVDPLTAADLYYRTLRLAGIDAERGRSIFEFLSTMYYDHRHILTSFVYIEKMKKQHVDQAAIVTIGPTVRVSHIERFQQIYTGRTDAIDSEKVDKSSVALEFYSVSKQRLKQCMDDVKLLKVHSCVPFEGLSAHQIAYTHSVMWDSKDLPRGHRANFVRRGLGGIKTSDIGELVAYSLFPVEMEERLVDSLTLLQKISLGPPELLRDYVAVNKRIREVVPDEFFADFSFRE